MQNPTLHSTPHNNKSHAKETLTKEDFLKDNGENKTNRTFESSVNTTNKSKTAGAGADISANASLTKKRTSELKAKAEKLRQRNEHQKANLDSSLCDLSTRVEQINQDKLNIEVKISNRLKTMESMILGAIDTLSIKISNMESKQEELNNELRRRDNNESKKLKTISDNVKNVQSDIYNCEI